METTLTKVCEYLNNFFDEKRIAGTFQITGGTLEVAGIKEGQYIRITGSTFNNGVHIYPATDLKDEEFEGQIWAMAVPETIIALTPKIEAWEAKYGSVNSPAMSPYNSESFNNYSYSKDGGAAKSGGSNVTWRDVYASELNPYRRLRGAR